MTPRAPRAREEIFHGYVGRLVQVFEPFTEAAPIAVAAQFLVAFGNLLGRKPHFYVGETTHHLNENVLLVGGSSYARKGDSKNIALRVLKEVDDAWAANITGGLSSGEGLIHAVRDPVMRTDRKGEQQVIDEGVPDKRLLIVETEFSQPLKQFVRDGNVLSNVIRDAWDAKHILRTITKTNPSRATDAHISIIGHSTLEDLAKYLSDSEAANGLGNRFLLLLTRRAKLVADPDRAPAAAVNQLVAELREILDAARQVDEIRRTPEAAATWKRIYPDLTRERPGLLGKLLARSEAHTARLSRIYALLDRKAHAGVEHLNAALAFVDYATESTAIIFAGRTGNDLADKIRMEMLPGQTLTIGELQQTIFNNHAPAGRLHDALTLLKDLGEIRTGSEPTGGRPRLLVTRIDPKQTNDREADRAAV